MSLLGHVRSVRRIRVTLDREADCVAEGPDMTLPANTPAAIAAIFDFLEDEPKEQFWVLALDARHKPVGVYRVSEGHLTSSLVHPREVFAPALALGTVCAIAVVHNHPSGDPEPSMPDIALTKRLREAGDILGISLLDHVVVAFERYVSLRERGYVI